MQQLELKIGQHKIAALLSERRDGPNIVFIPGITTSISFWPAVIPEAIKDSCYWAALSLPCHFPSVAPNDFNTSDVSADLFIDLLADAIKAMFPGKKVHLVGWSTGGFSALAIASKHPDIVASATSISGFSRGTWGRTLGLLQRIARLGYIGKLIFRLNLRLLSRFRSLFAFTYLDLAFNRQKASDIMTSTLPIIHEGFRKLDRKDMACLFAGIRNIDVSALIAQMTVPALVIGGEKDRVIKIAETNHIASLSKQIKLEIIKDTGHLFFAEAPREVWALISDWIKQHD